MKTVSDNGNDLLNNLHELSERQKIPVVVAEHLEHYFSDADIAGSGEAPAEELHGAALQHYKHGISRLPRQATIAIYTPDFDRHGWHSPHTVIDIVTDDMPFLVDSITMAINRNGLAIHRLMHPVLGVQRDASGKLRKSAERGTPGMSDESWAHVEIDRISDLRQIKDLRDEIADVLSDVRAAVEDLGSMRNGLISAIADLAPAPPVEKDEAAEFLRWLAADNFVFLGYAHYFADTSAGELKRDPEGGFGLLRQEKHQRFGRCLAGIPGNLAEIAKAPSALTLVKADGRSTVHRPRYLDFIGIRHRNPDGRIIGEHVFVGLYAMHVYHVSTGDIPVVRNKVAAVRVACGFAPRSHKDKTLINVLETYPRDELIEIATNDLLRIASGIVMLQELPRVRVFMRNDNWGRYVSALVYLPRDQFNSEVRKRIVDSLKETLKADSVDFSIMANESGARLHLIARLPAGSHRDYDADAFERGVARIVRGWHDELRRNLIQRYGEESGNTLLRRYALALPLSYQDQVPPSSAVSDLENLEAAEYTGQIQLKLNAPYGDDGSHQHLKLFLCGQPRPLSAVLPAIENMGVTVLTEQPFTLNERDLHIADFAVRLARPEALDDEDIRRPFVELLQELLRGDPDSMVENDGFNRLVLSAGLDKSRITILRAYGRYLRQAGMPFNQGTIERCLASYPDIARSLAELFLARLSPEANDQRADAIGKELVEALGKVSNADDDRILSSYRIVIEATVRTNAWQTGADGLPKPYLSFKISSRDIPFLPKPVPLYEIFVYSPRMEGIHLRGSRVSRGGLRWSDRMEDYRTEGVALVKAQMVKNVVSVPLGAKGCFVGKRLPPATEREAWLAEGIACYSIYIRGLLDLTDNLVDGRIVPPKDVHRRDGDDAYLVVAADKGTATFSDYANAIAIEYGFWLGDAFASGGSRGFDHKKIGITARGAWEAAKRHFREMGHDTQSEPFTAIGIGDLSGDVFGNGVRQSDKMRLIAAFDHRHVFIDPTPDPAKSFAERERLFALPRSSWDDYDKSLISAGGGVWPRSAKSIPLSAQVREWLGTDAEQMAPNELIHAILKAPADLLYNGGIGTYVKASTQSHQEANDRGNDAVRVDANELRVKVVVEGGNLGLTQKARIEFALRGGRINTDAIDNSAGVGTSDYEVNIKILVSKLVASGDMSSKQRDRLLVSMTDDIARRVLVQNYQQTGAIALESATACEMLDAHNRLIHQLETRGMIDRRIEALPDDKEIAERAKSHLGLTPPEIAVLLAYVKIDLKETILASSLPDVNELHRLLVDYFPPTIVAQCGDQLATHPLKREIITAQLVNRVVNRMGTTFTMQIGSETGATQAQVAAAWYAASEMLNAEAAWDALEALDLKIPAEQQKAQMIALREMLAAVTRQVLAPEGAEPSVANILAAYRERSDMIDEVRRSLPQDAASLTAGIAEIRRMLAA